MRSENVMLKFVPLPNLLKTVHCGYFDTRIETQRMQFDRIPFILNFVYMSVYICVSFPPFDSTQGREPVENPELVEVVEWPI